MTSVLVSVPVSTPSYLCVVGGEVMLGELVIPAVAPVAGVEGVVSESVEVVVEVNVRVSESGEVLVLVKQAGSEVVLTDITIPATTA